MVSVSAADAPINPPMFASMNLASRNSSSIDLTDLFDGESYPNPPSMCHSIAVGLMVNGD